MIPHTVYMSVARAQKRPWQIYAERRDENRRDAARRRYN
jgi:hypothetical protein